MKIDTLKIEDESDTHDDGDDINEDGEKVKRSKEGGPWSKLVASDSLEKPESEENSPGNKLLHVEPKIFLEVIVYQSFSI